jgi:hypothetical protein
MVRCYISTKGWHRFSMVPLGNKNTVARWSSFTGNDGVYISVVGDRLEIRDDRIPSAILGTN